MIKIEIVQLDEGKDLWQLEQHDMTEVSWETFSPESGAKVIARANQFIREAVDGKV